MVCCLDEHFSNKLRQLLESQDELLEAPVSQFLWLVFKHVVLVTTHIENCFAHMRDKVHACANHLCVNC